MSLNVLFQGLGTLQRIYARTQDRELALIAAGVAFFGFLAVFPALAAVIAVWGFAADPSAIRSQLVLARDYLPPEAFALLQDQIETLLAVNSRDLGWTTVLSTLVALWSARAGVAALIRGLNAIHGLPVRGGVWHILQAIVLTAVLVALVLSAMALAVVSPFVIAFLPLGPWAAFALEGANLALGLVLVVAAIGAVYRLAPNREGRPPPLFTRGLLVAVVLWAAASRGLVIYLTNFASYNQVYGSIGAVAALLLWFYLSAYAVLLGAAVDAERQPIRQ